MKKQLAPIDRLVYLTPLLTLGIGQSSVSCSHRREITNSATMSKS